MPITKGYDETQWVHLMNAFYQGYHIEQGEYKGETRYRILEENDGKHLFASAHNVVEFIDRKVVSFHDREVMALRKLDLIF